VQLAGLPTDESPLLEGRVLLNEQATAYVCEHYACQLPTTDVDALRAQLDEISARRYRAAT
jgi:hypothetical protein